MPWQPERNRNSLSPHGIKEAEGHGARAMHDPNCVVGADMPDGITSMTPHNPDPHGAGPRREFQIAPSARRPANDLGPGLLPARGSLRENPHPGNARASHEQTNTYYGHSLTERPRR